MKKLKVTITHSYIKAMVHWLQDSIIDIVNSPNSAFEMKACCFIVQMWIRQERIRDLCTFPFKEKKQITLKNETAAAIAAIIALTTDMSHADYLGNYLQTLYASIDQHFKQFGA